MCVVGDLSEGGNRSHMFGSKMGEPTKCHFGRRVLSFHDREKCGPWRSRHDFKLYLKLRNLLVLTVYCGHDPCPNANGWRANQQQTYVENIVWQDLG